MISKGKMFAKISKKIELQIRMNSKGKKRKKGHHQPSISIRIEWCIVFWLHQLIWIFPKQVSTLDFCCRRSWCCFAFVLNVVWKFKSFFWFLDWRCLFELCFKLPLWSTSIWLHLDLRKLWSGPFFLLCFNFQIILAPLFFLSQEKSIFQQTWHHQLLEQLKNANWQFILTKKLSNISIPLGNWFHVSKMCKNAKNNRFSYL